MASLGGQVNSTKDSSDPALLKASRPSSVDKKTSVRDRDEKLRLAKERQNGERQRKIEELKAQAEAAQRYREQKEEERRRRIEELRSRDNDRRHQVEERKKAILEAEKERREYILRKNQSMNFLQERDARLDAKRKNERSSNVFAFGSSTPRLLDPADLGNVSPSAFWGHRRSTSITNVAYTGAPLTRRSSERDLADGSKKRATSAGGIDRQNDEDSTDSPPVSYRSVARRKTDLMPTIPSPREPSFGSKTSLQSNTPRTPGSRSGEVTPGGSINTSRPGSAMSTSTTASVQRRSVPPARKPRPASIAVTGVSLNEDGRQKKEKPPLPKMLNTPKRSNLNNTNSTTRISSADSNKHSDKKSLSRKEVTNPKVGTNVMHQSLDGRSSGALFGISKSSEPVEKSEEAKEIDKHQTKEEKDALNAVKTEVTVPLDKPDAVPEFNNLVVETNQNNMEEITEEKLDNDSEKGTKKDEREVVDDVKELSIGKQENEMTASMIARKITTEEEAKAALAERRRIAREEAERQAELERQRLEAERQAELKRQAEEEERQKKLEEESLRLAEAQRKAEEERLKQAIEEAKKREEESRLKKEEEEKQRIEREEAEKKAKEEAERQRLEVVERLKQEEKEREERRKRVEAIMSRTRPKGSNSTPNSTPTKDSDMTKSVEKAANDNTSDSSSSPEGAEIKSEMSASINQDQQQQQFKQSTDKVSYEQSVTDKENALMKSFSNLIIDENAKNFQNIQNPLIDLANGKILQDQKQTNDMTSHTMANGNGHIENLNKNDTNVLVDVPPVAFTDQLINLGTEPQQIADTVNFANNNSLLTSSTTLVNADSHESKEISLL